MDRYKENSYRGKAFLSDSTQLDTHLKTHSKPVLGAIMTLICLSPLLFYSCNGIEDAEERQMEMVPISLKMTKGKEDIGIRNIDIFTFDNDRIMRLDSYIRTDDIDSDYISLESRTGDKLIFACANSITDRYGWGDINTFSSLDNHISILEKENPDALVMTGSCTVKAGSSVVGTLNLRPLVSEVCLRSISCDFSGKAYEGELMKNVSVYLVNVNSRCSLTAEGKVMPTQIMNNGRLDEDEVAEFEYPEIIFRRIGQAIGSRKTNTDIRLLCYPNAAENEGPGTPFTRLVIEGEIEGKRYWWPIEVNRDNGTEEKGIYRNRRYIYDIVIRRKGMTSPDEPVVSEDIDISIETKTWNEKDSYTVGF
jgi:hypothetical protein